MKNKNYKHSILGLMILSSLIGGTTGCLKKYDNNEVDAAVRDALEKYEERRNELQDEIDELKKQREQLVNERTFHLNDLIVGEIVENDGSKELYIFDTSSNTGIFNEIHDDFNAWFNLHDKNDEHDHMVCASYYHIYQENISLLALLLNDDELEEIRNNDGKLKTSQADKILERIREEYHSSDKLRLNK